MRYVIGLGVAVLFAASAAPAAENVPLDQVPCHIISAVQAEYPTARILKVERDTEDGQPIYEVDLRERGRQWEAEFDTAGNFLNESGNMWAPGPRGREEMRRR